MPSAVPNFGARLATRLASWAPALPSWRPRRNAVPTAAAPDAKSSLAGPLIAFEHLRQPVWRPRDYTAFANEGFMQNAIVYRCVRMIAECSAHVPLILYDGDQEVESHPLAALMRRPNDREAWPDFM